jgi:hypothetical protein
VKQRLQLWLWKFLGLDRRAAEQAAQQRAALQAHFDALEAASQKRQTALLAALALINQRLTVAGVDLRQPESAPVLDWETVSAIAMRALENSPPPKDSPFAEEG